MNLTEIKLKALILEAVDDEDEELKKLVQKAVDQAIATPSPEMFETLMFTIEAMGVPIEKVSDYMDPLAIADKLLDAADNNLDEDLKGLFEMLERFQYPLENLRGYINLEDIKKALAGVTKQSGEPSSYVAMIDLLVNLGAAYGEDLTDLGGTLDPHMAAYMNNLVASAIRSPDVAHRTKWAPLLVTVEGQPNQDWLFTLWLRARGLLTDEELIKLYQSAVPAVKERMQKSRKLSKYFAVVKVMNAHMALKKSARGRLRAKIRKKKK